MLQEFGALKHHIFDKLNTYKLSKTVKDNTNIFSTYAPNIALSRNFYSEVDEPKQRVTSSKLM